MSDLVCPAAPPHAGTWASRTDPGAAVPPRSDAHPRSAAGTPPAAPSPSRARGGAPADADTYFTEAAAVLWPTGNEGGTGPGAKARPASPRLERAGPNRVAASLVRSPATTPPSPPWEAVGPRANVASTHRCTPGPTPVRSPVSSRPASVVGSAPPSRPRSPVGEGGRVDGAFEPPLASPGALHPALERLRIGPGGWRRPGMARLGSTASAVVQVVPSASQARYEEFVVEMARALSEARATGSLSYLRRKRGVARLRVVARKLAGPDAVHLGLEQTRSVIQALGRPQALAGAPAQLQAEQAVLTGGPVAQPSMKPLLRCIDELSQQAHRVCDVTLAVERDEDLVLKLRRTGAALAAAATALSTYQHYTHTPGHRHLGEYRQLLNERAGWVAERQRHLVQKERSEAPG